MRLKGRDSGDCFYRELCVDVLVNITIVAVKRLIKRGSHDKLNCQ